MTFFGPAVLLLSMTFSSAAKGHDDNPLFDEVTKEGVDVGAKKKAMLPAPTMADGLNAAEQKKVIENLIQDVYDLENFTRNSDVGPNILRITDVKPFDPKAPARRVDFWFVAYGDWKKVANREFLDKAFNTSADNKTKNLTAADLAKRKFPAAKANEAYGYGSFDLFGKALVASTGRTTWSKTDESFLVAGKIDQRFDKDAEFPNQWRTMTKDDDGKTVLGPAQPYHGAGYYMKMTRLAQPAGAILIEAHIVFTEPLGWFNGENYLRSKLSLALSSQTKVLRREFRKTLD